MMRTDGLRPIVEALDREMSRLVALPDATAADTSALLASWADLVEYLALGPRPVFRASTDLMLLTQLRLMMGWRSPARTPPPALPAATPPSAGSRRHGATSSPTHRITGAHVMAGRGSSVVRPLTCLWLT